MRKIPTDGRTDVEIPKGPDQIEHFMQAQGQLSPADKLMVENCLGVVCGHCLHECPAHTYRAESD